MTARANSTADQPLITIGVIGDGWRAGVTRWGAIVPDDGRGPLDWYVLAEDRWHVPAREPTVRQRRIDGMAVVETRLKIPGGDAVQRVYSVAENGGMTIIEIENDSSRAIAVAFDRSDLATERPVGSTPITGLDLPSGSFVVPVGHRSTIRVGWAHHRPDQGRLPAGLPDHRSVVGGWGLIVERGSRFSIPATTIMDEIAAARCEIVLGTLPEDPAGFVLAVEELSRLAEPVDRWIPEVAAGVEAIAAESSWRADAAIAAAERIMLRHGERRAATDVNRLLDRRRADRGRSPIPVEQPAGIELVAWLERSLVCETRLFPDGLDRRWFGVDLEAHDLPLGRGLETISFALRWHGDRPAILWEQSEEAPLTAPLVAPEWSSSDRRGEALWPAPTGST